MTQKSRIIVLLSVMLSGMFISCEKGVFGIRGKGELVEKEFSMSEIKGVELCIEGNVHLTQSDTQSLVIEAQQNIMDNLELSVNNGILKIDFDRKVRRHKTVQIYLSIKELVKAEISGSGDINGSTTFTTDEDLRILISGSGDVSLAANAANVDAKIEGSGNISLTSNTETVDAVIAGSGNININGSATSINYSILGSGDINAFGMIAETVSVNIDGSGDCNVYASKTLNVDIDGSGDVNYKGGATANSKIDGSGEVRSVD